MSRRYRWRPSPSKVTIQRCPECGRLTPHKLCDRCQSAHEEAQWTHTPEEPTE